MKKGGIQTMIKYITLVAVLVLSFASQSFAILDLSALDIADQSPDALNIIAVALTAIPILGAVIGIGLAKRAFTKISGR